MAGATPPVAFVLNAFENHLGNSNGFVVGTPRLLCSRGGDNKEEGKGATEGYFFDIVVLNSM